MTVPAELYRAELERSAAALASLERRFARMAAFRLAVFVAGVAVAIWTVLSRGGLGLGVLGLLGAVFLVLVVYHERIARARASARASVGYYDRGLARLEGRWTEGGDDGARFADSDHLYASDLELFGKGSLFHLVSTARAETGAATLAAWLKAPADPATIVLRQGAIAELAPNFRLRHDLGTVGPDARAALDSPALREWATSVGPRIPRWAPAAAAAAALLNVVVAGAAIADRVPGLVVTLVLLGSAMLAQAVRRSVQAILQAADRPARELRLVALLLERVRHERFTSPALVRLADTWSASDEAAPALVARLERLIDLVDARRNQLFLPISGLLLLGTQLAFAIERWRTRSGSEVVRWLETIGELEALAALATRAFEEPLDTFAQIGPAGTPLEARGIAHPLLPTERAVRNDLDLAGPLRLLVVSGSNMSGKSTLLKAVGANLVLAQAGGPVRAHHLSTPPLTLGASLVLRDSLLEGRSRFFAEVLRLRDIARLAETGRPVLFLLDELLSGTNSHDRAIGARGVLQGLIERGAIGIVTTHDLALAEIARELGPRAANWHFDDELVDGKLVFDYRLKPGVVTRSNALELMRMVGLATDGPAGGRTDGQ